VIPVVFPDPDLYPVSDANLEGLINFDIVLSGYWELEAGQSATDARDAHQTATEAVLYEMAAAFSHAGARTEVRLHFGPPGKPERDYQANIAQKTDAVGIMKATQFSSLLNILIPLRDIRHQDGIVEFVSQLNPDSIFITELYHIAPDEASIPAAREMLEGVEETLLARGFTEADVEVTVEVATDARAALADCARDHHLVVMGETERPDADDQLFGPVTQYLATETGTPIIVVRE
jgi:nucleotide-binding universal stress UspA family protein